MYNKLKWSIYFLDYHCYRLTLSLYSSCSKYFDNLEKNVDPSTKSHKTRIEETKSLQQYKYKLLHEVLILHAIGAFGGLSQVFRA